MKGAKLIKRAEALQRKQTDPLPLKPKAVVGVARETAKMWVRHRQETLHPNPRAAFAALFAPLEAPAAPAKSVTARPDAASAR